MMPEDRHATSSLLKVLSIGAGERNRDDDDIDNTKHSSVHFLIKNPDIFRASVYRAMMKSRFAAWEEAIYVETSETAIHLA